MAELETVETQTVETRETQPNEPAWVFPADASGDEREQLAADIVAALKTVYDPEIPCDIYELGLIYKIDLDEGRQAKVEMTLTAPGCPVADEIVHSVEGAVGAVGGVSGVAVNMVFDPPWSQVRMSDEARVSLDMY